MQWFDVDKEGLRKLIEKKNKSFALFELIQNALDEKTTRVDVTLERIPGSRHAMLVVTDDAPDGFADLSHAFTLFAESSKKGDAEKRGRFNAGEKFVIACCTEVSIMSTTGTIVFNAEGRSRIRAKTDRGSVFTGRIRMSNEELAECAASVKRLLVPQGVMLNFNGEQIPSRSPVRTLQAALQTEVSDAEGCMRRTTRQTVVELYEPREGEEASLYEMGIPVTATGDDKYHINIAQKVPLSFDRDSVPAAFIAKLRALVVSEMAGQLEQADANSLWVKDAVDRYGADLSQEAVERIVELRFGPKRVSYDPSDPEANKLAVVKGYQVVHGGNLSGNEWGMVRRTGAILPAGRVTPSPRPYSEDGEQMQEVDESSWSPRMHSVVALAKRLGTRLTGVEPAVVIVSKIGWPFLATYGPGRLTLNLGRLGQKSFEGDLQPILDLLLHEVSHHLEGDHLSQSYHRAITMLGAKMAVLALDEPEVFELRVNTGVAQQRTGQSGSTGPTQAGPRSSQVVPVTA